MTPLSTEYIIWFHPTQVLNITKKSRFPEVNGAIHRTRRVRDHAEEHAVLGVGVVDDDAFAPRHRPPHPAALVEAPEERIHGAQC